MKRIPTIIAVSLAILSIPFARAKEAKPTPAPEAGPTASASVPDPVPAVASPVASIPATAAGALSALPVPGRPNPRPGTRFETLPPAEKEHVRKMAELRKKRDAAERELLGLSDEAAKRKKAILSENEEARKLQDHIDELKADFAASTNALETIYREDEKLAEIAARIGPLQKTIDESQTSLNHEVSTAMQLRMAAQRAAWEKAHPAPKPPEENAKEGAEADSSASAPEGKAASEEKAVPEEKNGPAPESSEK